MKTFYSLLCLAMLCSVSAFANNVVISNISVVNGGPAAIQVQFDLSWDNSWRTNVGPANYDGVWVFFKYKDATGTWKHIYLTGNNNVEPSGVDFYQTNDFNKTGVMIYRNTNGTGTTSITGARVGATNTLPYDIDVRGFAIEMVYIPAPTSRPFFGDGDGTTESANAFHYTDNNHTTSSVVPMLSDGAGTDDAEMYSDGIYVYSNDTIQLTNPLGSLDPFPTMKALWCMKYEISQAQYRDFLNTLDSQQQANRTFNPPSSAIGTGALTTSGTARNYIEIATPATSTTAAVYGCDANNNNVCNEAGDGEWIACGFLLYQDVAAYLDWSGLAPMSELQFERICRGSSSAGAQPAILGEFAWGTNTIAAFSYTLSGAGTSAEVVSNASASVGNAAYASTTASTGPYRTGNFATAVSNRITSGGSYYGTMDMTGNLDEFVITLGCLAGRSCRYIPNGNGAISVNGNAQLSVGGAGFWPGMEGNTSTSVANTCSGTCEITASAGAVTKGGAFNTASASLPFCARSYFLPTARASSRGGRGVLYIR